MKNKKNKRDEFLTMIPGAVRRVLDVGCGRGALSAKLKAMGKEVVAIDCVPELTADAARIADRVYTADIETFAIPKTEKPFDCILYADVLEHLLDPSGVLQKHRAHLLPEGCVVASIPNVRYYKIIASVFGGRWDYSDCGLLDRTHVRFFGLINIKELFASSGYRIVELKRNMIGARWLRALNCLCFGRLKDFLTYQYYVRAVKTDEPYASLVRPRNPKSI